MSGSHQLLADDCASRLLCWSEASLSRGRRHPPCHRKPSISSATIRPGQAKSTCPRRRVPSEIGYCLAGAGNSASTTRRRKAISATPSSSEPVNQGSSAGRSSFTRRRPGVESRQMTACSLCGRTRCLQRASSRTSATTSGSRHPARSTRVRDTAVTGSRPIHVRSLVPRFLDRCTTTFLSCRATLRPWGTVRWITSTRGRSRFHAVAAERCDRTAPGPMTRHAASAPCSQVRGAPPGGGQTPRPTGDNVPFARRVRSAS